MLMVYYDSAVICLLVLLTHTILERLIALIGLLGFMLGLGLVCGSSGNGLVLQTDAVQPIKFNITGRMRRSESIATATSASGRRVQQEHYM